MSNRIAIPKVDIPPDEQALVRKRAAGRSGGVGALLAVVLAGIAARGAVLCVDPDQRTTRMGSGQRWGQTTLRADRGDILDRNGRRLATSVDAPSVIVDPMLVQPDQLAELAGQLANILDMPADEVREKLGRDGRYVRLKTRVHPAQAQAVRELHNPALWILRDPRRYYPEQDLAAQVLGFVDSTGVGKEGLESSLDELLDGGSILITHRRNRVGQDLDPEDVQQATDEGRTVHTTIDRAIQRAAERALADIVERHHPVAAYATVIDVRTGDILAMANVPTFNPNDLDGDAAARKNHAVVDAIEPGSVFKPFTVAAAIEEKLVTIDSTIDCEGGLWALGRARIHDDHPHKLLTIGELIKFSSNIGSSKLALRLGAERVVGYLGDFGFGERTDVALPGERRGRVRDPKSIKPIELATTSFGQGVTVTQLQLAMATAAIANGGELMRPRIVSLVEDSEGVPVWVQEPTVVRRVVSQETARQVTAAMLMVTEEGGTGTRAQVPGYRVAGKTGTAQKVKEGRYSEARIGSFMGFLPADNPQVVIVVTVDEPTVGSRYGGTVAGPAFAEIGAFTMRHLGIPADPSLLKHPPVVADAVADVEDEPLALAWGGRSWSVPDVRGRSVREVASAIQGAGLELRIEGSGYAVRQDPPPGAALPLGGVLAVAFQ